MTTAQEGTPLPFDVFDIPTHFWDSQDTLERKLKADVQSIAERFAGKNGCNDSARVNCHSHSLWFKLSL
ncbi:MAG: hypothetical protein ACJ746_29830 [Bryobacteraceae bacterium]